MIIEDRPQNRNVKTSIVNGRYVSSAEIWRFFGHWSRSFETFVWEIDEANVRGDLIYMTYQRNENEAIKVHDYMVRNFKNQGGK